MFSPWETGAMSNVDDRNGARQAKPERARFGPRFEVRDNNLRTVVERAPDGGPPIGSVDLRPLNYVNMEDWERGGGFRREVQPRRQHWFLKRKPGFPFRTLAFCSVSKGQRRLGEKEYRAPSVTPGVALRVGIQGGANYGLRREPAVAFVLEVMREVFAEHVWPLEDKAVAFDKRLVLAELESAALKSENASLKRDIAMLGQRLIFNLERRAASVGRPKQKGGRGKKAAGNGRSFPHGSSDAAQLPDSIIRRMVK